MRRLAALSLVAGLLAAGCWPPRTPPPDLSLDPAQLAAQVRAAQAAVHRVRGETRLHLHAPQSGTLRQFAAAELPDRVHLEELDFFGNPAAVLVAAGGRFALYDSREKVLYRGAATPANLSRLVPLPLEAPELAALLLGTALLPAGPPESVSPDGARLRLRYRQGDAVLDYYVGPHALVEKLVRAEAGGAGPGSYQVSFTAHRQRGGAWFPDFVELRADPARVRLELAWTEVEVNGDPEPKLFEPPAPKGARVVEVGDGSDGS